MSIEAKMVTSLVGGHGLTEELLEPIFAELAKGKSAGLIPALVLIQPLTGEITPGKNKRIVKFKLVRVEPVVNQADADAIRMSISEAYEGRQSNGQGALDLGEDDARRYLGFIDEWRKEQKLSVTAVKDKWREHFGLESGMPADYRKAGSQPLHEFALTVGAIKDEVPVDG